MSGRARSRSAAGSPPAWPAEYGGAGLTSIEQFVFGEEMARAHAPPVGGNGVVMLGPTLIVHGSEAQRREVLPRMLAGDYVYAQGYSEPGAGSDLASLATRAERDGDEYVINGQKIWTSGAHHADALFMLVRTDPTAPKHRGISFLLVPKLDTPGIEVRPLLDMTYGHYFNEVFFENVRVPVAQRVGEENRGWYVGMTLLDFERSGVAGAVAHEQNVAQLAGFLASAGGAAYGRLGVGARGAGGALDRGGRLAAALAAHRLDAGGGADAEPGGVDGQAVQHGAGAAHRAHGDAGAGAARAALARRAARPAARQLHLPLRAPGPDHDLWRLLRDPAQHHRHARPRAASRLRPDASPLGRGRSPFASLPDEVSRVPGKRRSPEDLVLKRGEAVDSLAERKDRDVLRIGSAAFLVGGGLAVVAHPDSTGRDASHGLTDVQTTISGAEFRARFRARAPACYSRSRRRGTKA